MRFLERLFHAGLQIGAHPLHFFLLHAAVGHEPIGVQLEWIVVFGNGLVQLRLREHGLVAFVVAVFAVPQQIDVDVLVPPLAVGQRDAHDLNHGFRLVSVDVEYERLGHFANIGAVNRAPPVQVIRREAHLVVDHDVDGSARPVAIELGHLRYLVDNTLARDRSVTVDQDRQDRRFFTPQGINACT